MTPSAVNCSTKYTVFSHALHFCCVPENAIAPQKASSSWENLSPFNNSPKNRGRRGGGAKFLKKEEEKKNTTRCSPLFFPPHSRLFFYAQPHQQPKSGRGRKRREEREERSSADDDDVFSTQASQLSEPTSVNPTITCPPEIPRVNTEFSNHSSLFSAPTKFFLVHTSAGRFFESWKNLRFPFFETHQIQRTAGWCYFNPIIEPDIFMKEPVSSGSLTFPCVGEPLVVYRTPVLWMFWEPVSKWMCTRMITGGYILCPGSFSTCMSGKQFISLKRFDLDEQKIPKDSSFSSTQTCSLRKVFF